MDYENLRLLCGHIKRKSDNTSCVVFMRTGRQSTPDFLLVSFHEDNRVEYYHYFKSSIDAYNAYVRKAEGGRAREVGSKESSAMSYFLKEGGSSVRARDPIAIEETMGLIHTRRFFVEHRLQNWAKAWDEKALEQKANAAIEQAGRKAVEKLDNLAKEAFFKSENPPMTLIGASLVTGNDMSCLSMWANDKGEIKILAGTGSIIYQGHSLNEAKGAAFNHINTRLALAEREGRVRLIDQLRQHQLPISNMFDGFYINRNQVVISEFAQELRAVGVYDSLLVSLPGNCRDEMDRQDLRNGLNQEKSPGIGIDPAAKEIQPSLRFGAISPVTEPGLSCMIYDGEKWHGASIEQYHAAVRKNIPLYLEMNLKPAEQYQPEPGEILLVQDGICGAEYASVLMHKPQPEPGEILLVQDGICGAEYDHSTNPQKWFHMASHVHKDEVQLLPHPTQAQIATRALEKWRSGNILFCENQLNTIIKAGKPQQGELKWFYKGAHFRGARGEIHVYKDDQWHVAIGTDRAPKEWSEHLPSSSEIFEWVNKTNHKSYGYERKFEGLCKALHGFIEPKKGEQNVPLIEEGTLKYFSYKDSRVKKWAGSGVYGWIKDEWVALNTTEHCFKDISAESPLELIRVMNLPANVTGAWLSHKKKVLSRYCVNDIQPPPVPEPAEEPRINASHGQDKLWDETPPTEQELWEFLQARKLVILPEDMHFYELAERKYTTVAKPEPTPQDINATHPPLFQGRPLTKAEASLLDKYKAEIEEAEELQVVKAMEEALNNQRKEAEMQAKELQEAKGRLSKIRKGQKKKAAIVQTMSLSAMATLMVYLIISRVFGRPVPALKLNAPNKLKKKRRRRDHQEEGPVREAIALPPAKGEEIPTRSRRRTKSKA